MLDLVLLLWVLVGGFLVNPASIPVWVRWLRYASPLSYGFEGLFSNEIRGLAFNIAVWLFGHCGTWRGTA